MSITSCAFTGHRPSRFAFGYDEEDSLCGKIKLALLSQITTLYANGVSKFYTGCSLGVDMWAGEIVLSLMESTEFAGIELHSIIPYENQAAKWSTEHRERYYTMLEKSTTNILLAHHYYDGCYFDRNKWLVDHTNIVLAVYDMTEKKRSGTGHTVNYAKQNGRGIIYIHPDTGEITPIHLRIV